VNHISFEQNQTFSKPSWVTVLLLEHIFILFHIDSDVLGFTTLSEWLQAGFFHDYILLSYWTVLVGKDLTTESCMVERCCNVVKGTDYFVS
jgi:hypothetical protein